MIKDLRLVTNAELRAQTPQGDTPEDDANNGDQQQSDKQQPKTIEGYALLFNSPSKDLGGFVEVIDPAALDNVDLSNVIMLDQHDYSKPLASVKAGTLKLDTDDKGLHFTAELDPSVSYASDAYANVKSGNVDSMSFRFDIDDGGDEFTQDDQGNVTRTIKQVKDLFEVSTVTIPAYDDSNVQVDKRSYEEFLDNQKGEDTKMTKQTIIDPAEQGETRSFDNYVRSMGETRDGLSTDGNGVLIPTEIITPIFQSKKNSNRLSDYATVKQVSTGQGSYPIAGNDPSKVLATKAENAAIGDVDPEVTGVEFKTQTRAGKVYLSQELVDDNAINFSAEIQAQMQKLVDNTDNAQIVAKLKTLTPVVVKDIDGIKQAKNTQLDPSLQPIVIVNQSAFNWLDTQKDN
ncbi:phage major capsid protein, partial [Lactiplantibacillus plantarum]|uniref:phage major capsid protein n=1 Tax=Lactiplantibacillus plantarum TaxID=1590 RepID=UPI001FCD713A